MPKLHQLRKIQNRTKYLLSATLVAFFVLSGTFSINGSSKTASAARQCVVNTDNIIGWWKGEDNLNAEVGPGLNGTVGYETAKVGKGIQFNGYNGTDWDYAYTNDLATVSNAVTTEAWIKPGPDDGLSDFVISRWEAPQLTNGTNSYGFVLSGNTLSWSTDETSTRAPEVLSANAPQLRDGEYHHIAGTWDSYGGIYVYVDGQVVASRSAIGGLLNPAPNTQFRLGRISGTGMPFPYQGVIDEATVYNRALAANEVAAIYNAGANGKCQNVDLDAPTITVNTPTEGTVYVLGQTVLADYGCQDEADGSGLATCEGTIANGSAIDTATAGNKSFTVNTSDNAGNTDSVTVHYKVAYQKGGFFSPVNNDLINKAKAGSTVPLKWRLTDASGNPIGDAGSFLSVTSGSTTCDLSDPADEVEEYTGNSGLQYLGDGNWQFNWKTSKTYAGQCRVVYVNFVDGTSLSARFQLK